MFFFVLLWVGSMILGVSAQSFAGMWLFLELNLISFVLLVSIMSVKSEVMSLKYFMVQTVSTGLFFFGAIALLGASWSLGEALLVLALAVKMGAAPFHFWVLNIVGEMSWDVFFYFSTFQKLLPLWLTFSLSKSSGTLWLVALGSVFTVLGLWQLNTKSLLVYSSVLGISWMILSEDFQTSLAYLVVYGVSLMGVCFFLESGSSEHISLYSCSGVTKSDAISMMFFVLNMSGLPPFALFFVKAAIVLNVASSHSILVGGVLLASGAFFVAYFRLFMFGLLSGTSSLSQGQPHYGLGGSSILAVSSAVVVWLL
uniref:NADH-ubiquinone oxidoreductase chain 2 n=1 Tax=Schizopera knabeni TaxID=1432316 RepID=W8DNC0_9MAXI|nr:NADH dehydrogenase subunit 2 [Schizopera knabeni]